MVFNDGNIKEEMVKTVPLHGKTRSKDIFQSFHACLLEMKVPIHKLVSVATDGAPAMTSKNVGLIGLCKKDPAFPDSFSYHCVIRQQALCTKVINFQHVMSVVQKIVYSVCTRPLQTFDKTDTHYGDLILHTEVRWLSRGKILFRFQKRLPTVMEFLPEVIYLHN
jgi:hypothetical protein